MPSYTALVHISFRVRFLPLQSFATEKKKTFTQPCTSQPPHSSRSSPHHSPPRRKCKSTTTGTSALPMPLKVNVDWVTNYWNGANNCYNFQYANFANIAGCWEDGGCFCNFFDSRDCQGSPGYRASSTGNCIPVGGAQSFACYWGTT